MKLYAVIDTNVLVSAMLKWQSVPGKIIEMVFYGLITPLLSDEIIKEYRAVLMRDKFCLTNAIVDDVISTIVECGEQIEAERIEIEMPDPKDRVFYEIAMRKRQTEKAYLVTGNIKHFPKEDFIVTPREFIEIINESCYLTL